MGEHVLDDLAEGLDHGTVSRGQTLKLAGAALVATLFGGFIVAPAGAQSSSQGRSGGRGNGGGRGPAHRQNRRSSRARCCPRGSFRTTACTPQGECRCAPIAFAGGTTIPCNRRSCCFCTFTIEGEGFCVDGCQPLPDGTPCTSSSDCAPPLTKCVVNANGGASCLPGCPSP
jgi:hypothetical protein